MSATRTAPAPSRYRSGWCSSGYHERCRGAYAGVTCDCPHHQKGDVDDNVVDNEMYTLNKATLTPEPPAPAARLAAAARALSVGKPLPVAALSVLADLLTSESTWASDRADHYPADRAPLLKLADLITEGTAA